MTRLEELRDYLEEMNTAVPDAVEAAELDNLARSVPKLISILPDVLRDPSDLRHQAAVSEMTAHLTTRLDRVKPMAIVRNRLLLLARRATPADNPAQHQSSIPNTMLNDGLRIHNIRTSAYERFLKTIEAA